MSSSLPIIKRAIIIFARLPIEGKVKTRLADKTSNEFAMELYKLCAEHTFCEVLKLKDYLVPFLFFSDNEEINEMQKWAGKDFKYIAQEGKNLGNRMQNAFTILFESGFEQVIIIGTDLPDISSGLIRKAYDKLNVCDVVIGPAEDGGYYLIGMKKLHKELFSDIKWSTETVFGTTIDRLGSLNVSFSTLQKLTDIDTVQSLNKWIKELKPGYPEKIENFVKRNLH